jgi:spore maturation protein CgeB
LKTPRSVLISGPVFADTFADNIIYTLREMGVLPIFDQQETRKGRLVRFAAVIREFGERANVTLPNLHEQRLLRLAQDLRPELFLSPTMTFSDEFLARLRVCGVRHCVAWWGDPPSHMKRMGLLSRQWDVILFKDPDAVKKFRRVGLNAHLMHEAMNPAWHKPVASQANQEVAIVGNFYGYRQFLVMQLIHRGVEVGLYGGGLPRWADPEIKRIHRGRYVVREEKSRVFGVALACLNSTQIAEGNSLNCRAFEIAGAGGLPIMEYRPIISECFEPGKEILTFDLLDELMAHLDRAKRFPGEMTLIREAAARRALNCHTYRRRLETIFSMIPT